jgi:hypothetical protein
MFLARAVYRIRRLRDAARLLPVVGLFLLLLPLLWDGDQGGGAVVFVFVIWALLIGGAALLAPALDQPDDGDPAQRDGPG